MRDDQRPRTRGVAHRARRAAAVLVLLTATVIGSTPAAGLPLADPVDELVILAVETGEPTQVLFAAPAQLMTRTLTNDDVVASVDGVEQPVRLQRLSATDLEVAVVVDTTLGTDELRALQGAVVELALDLPPGATMRIIGADGAVAPPAPVPGPAIAQVRQLRPDSAGDLQRAVDEATRALSASAQDRTALLVVGRDLDARIASIDDLPVDTAVAYVVNVGAGGVSTLLGPRTSGSVIVVDDLTRVLPAIDGMSNDLRNLYRAEVTAPGDAQTLTLEIPAAGETGMARTVALDPGSVRPADADPVTGQPDGAGDAEPAQPAGAEPARPDPGRDAGRIPLAVALGAVLLVLLILVVASLVRRRGDRLAAEQHVLDEPPTIASGAPRAHRPATTATRPIAKLTPETREALARAHLSLRNLALASRAVADRVPDDLFRLAEARASVALGGQRVTLHDVLVAALSQDDATGTVDLVRRVASALSTGWQHTARRRSAPPPVVEISAALTGGRGHGHTDDTPRPMAPVRALNPLVEIGLEHIVLAARDERDSRLVARAVTIVDIMRAARLARPVLMLSPLLLDQERRYRAALNADLNDAAQRDRWLQLLCESVAGGADECTDRLTRLGALRDRWRDRADSAHLLPLIDLTLAQPILDAAVVARRLSVPDDTARRLLATADQSGWLRRHSRAHGTWASEQVLTLFARSTDNREPSTQPA